VQHTCDKCHHSIFAFGGSQKRIVGIEGLAFAPGPFVVSAIVSACAEGVAFCVLKPLRRMYGHHNYNE
jgi:hypothetical protein